VASILPAIKSLCCAAVYTTAEHPCGLGGQPMMCVTVNGVHAKGEARIAVVWRASFLGRVALDAQLTHVEAVRNSGTRFGCIGLAISYRCILSHRSTPSSSVCVWFSTPSAVTRLPRLWPSLMTAPTMAVSLWSTCMSVTKVLSILR